MNMIDKLRSLADDIEAGKGAPAAWALIGRLIGRTPADPAAASAVVKAQDLAGLRALLNALEGKTTPVPPPSGPSSASAPAAFSHDDLGAAMRAFKKRLKLVRLNDESRLSGRLLSGGHASEIDAITAPNDFPHEMWQELAKQGRLVDTGGGFYMLPK